MAEDNSAFIDYLDTRFNLTEVSGGRQTKVSGQCPFCGEDRADMRLYVNTETGLGMCFHCNTPFNPIKFVMACEPCSYEKAKQIVQGDPDGWAKSKPQPKAISGLVWPASTPIADSAIASAYLSDRGIDADLINHFKLYYCQHPTPIGEKVFHTDERVIIPIHDITGQAISWIGRTIGKAMPKYLFPPAFKGAEVLFNAWSIPRYADYVIICEGVFDAFGWWRHGAKNVVATFGKKISAGQIELLKSISAKLVIIAWDYDAMWENYSFAEKFGHLFNIKIVNLGGKDADECNPQELRKALVNAKGFSWEAKILQALN